MKKKSKKAIKREIESRKKLIKAGRASNKAQISKIKTLEALYKAAYTGKLVLALFLISMPLMAWDYGFKPNNQIQNNYPQNQYQPQQEIQPNPYNNYQSYPQPDPNELRREEVRRGRR